MIEAKLKEAAAEAESLHAVSAAGVLIYTRTRGDILLLTLIYTVLYLVLIGLLKDFFSPKKITFAQSFFVLFFIRCGLIFSLLFAFLLCRFTR